MDVREKLVELLTKYFTIGDSYAYNLTRVKEAFSVGTMTIDDFVEFDDETVEDIADNLIAHGVTVQEWISVNDRLPEESGEYIVFGRTFGNQKPKIWICECISIGSLTGWCNSAKNPTVTHWMPLPQPPKGE